MRDTDSNLPSLHLLEALRQHSRRPYRHRRLTRSEIRSLDLAELVERGTADDLLEAAAARYWHYRAEPDGTFIHRQLPPDAMMELCYLHLAARRKRAGLDVSHIARMFVEKEAATWAEIERVVAARKAAGMDTALMERIIAGRKKAAK